VKDAEFIYSLYVQANPVADPDLLPLTKDEAVLLALERSPDMITQEHVEKRQPEAPPRRKRLVPALAAAAVLTVAVVAAAILMSGDPGPVAAADANPVVVFDGTTCSYEGPTLIEEGVVEFSFENSADEAFYPIAWLVEEPALTHELELHPVGTDIDTTNEANPDGIVVIQGRIRPGATGFESQLSMRLEPGTYLFDCGTGLGPDRVWRAAQLEVVAP
jgi:hypothetical protein